MTRDGFADVLGWELLCRGVSFDPAELLEFVRDVLPFVRECPDPARWATLFLVARRLRRGTTETCGRVRGRPGGAPQPPPAAADSQAHQP